MVLDKPPYRSVGKLLYRLTKGRRPDEPRFNFTSRQWGDLLNRGQGKLGLGRKLVLYQLRHSGASNDILHQQQQIFCSERTVFFDVV